MQYHTIFRLLGLLLIIFSASMLTPLAINLLFHEDFWLPFISAFACTLGTGSTLWFCFNEHRKELKIRDGFLLVALFWFVLCFFAALPFLFALDTHHSFTDALFESVSGFTTTGATTIAHLETLPHALLFYRQQLQFLGGMGIVVLAIAILPMLGVGGMQLYRAEIPGPMKDTKLTPRLTQTAKALWFIYVFLTIVCAVCYWISGMYWFDALGESFATVSTGGFSMHDTGFRYYHSDMVETVASFFMLLGGTNFTLHFMVFKKRSFRQYWQDEECRRYGMIIFTAISIVAFTLIDHGYFKIGLHVIVKTAFNVISFITTTGFTSASFETWPTYIPILLLLLAIVGGCAASTSGGIKVLRMLLLYKQSHREMLRLTHPDAIIPIKFGKHRLSEPILQSMWGFLSAFLALFLLLLIIFMALGHDFLTAFSAITASLANAGAGLGQLRYSFDQLDQGSKWLLMFAMLAGRLEIFPLLILFSRQFWRK